jgi:hypothetical protein
MSHIDNITESNIDEDDEDKLPEYSDDEDFRKQMNEAIMRNINNQEITQEKVWNKKKKNIIVKEHKPVIIKDGKVSLGSFIKTSNINQPAKFVSQRKQDKTGLFKERQFNPRNPPYLLTKQNKTVHVLNEDDFPSL